MSIDWLTTVSGKLGRSRDHRLGAAQLVARFIVTAKAIAPMHASVAVQPLLWDKPDAPDDGREKMNTMPKAEFMHILRRIGELQAAAELERQLLDPVDFDRDAELLCRYGIRSAEQMVERLGGNP
jgi:hypothetical protein